MTARLLALPLMVAAALLASCGGSSSETPWPSEPKGAALGPAGESSDMREGDAYSSEPTDESEPAKEAPEANQKPQGSKP